MRHSRSGLSFERGDQPARIFLFDLLGTASRLSQATMFDDGGYFTPQADNRGKNDSGDEGQEQRHEHGEIELAPIIDSLVEDMPIFLREDNQRSDHDKAEHDGEQCSYFHG